jgi:hypothetical protein
MLTTTPMQFATPINTIQQVTEKRGGKQNNTSNHISSHHQT